MTHNAFLYTVIQKAAFRNIKIYSHVRKQRKSFFFQHLLTVITALDLQFAAVVRTQTLKSNKRFLIETPQRFWVIELFPCRWKHALSTDDTKKVQKESSQTSGHKIIYKNQQKTLGRVDYYTGSDSSRTSKRSFFCTKKWQNVWKLSLNINLFHQKTQHDQLNVQNKGFAIVEELKCFFYLNLLAFECIWIHKVTPHLWNSTFFK